MPSWSWAAMQSAKRWPSEETGFGWNIIYQAEELSERLAITPAGHLQVFGNLSTIKMGPSYVREKFTVRDLKLNGLPDSYDSWDRKNTKRPGVHILTSEIDGTRGYEKAVVGIAQFDNNTITTYTHACFLAKQKNIPEGYYCRNELFVKRELIVIVHHASIERLD
jgi:hypothetical protein